MFLTIFVLLWSLHYGVRCSLKSFVEGNNVLLTIDLLWCLVVVASIGYFIYGRM